MWVHILVVALGGAMGSVVRFLVAEVSALRVGTTFPTGH